jgi:hypothetical protein
MMRNGNMRLITVLILSMWGGQHVDATVVLNEQMLKLANISAFLSNEVYLSAPNVTATGFDKLEFFEEGDDAAILAEKDGYCYLSLRGDTMNLNDWYRNLENSVDKVCSEVDPKHCCNVRKGFYEAYMDPSYKIQMELKTRRCARKCAGSQDGCLVISGHSEGGGIAAVAGILFESYNPYVMTFGEPPSVSSDCDLIDMDRWYRFVNTVDSEFTSLGFAFDPVPFVPGVGNMIYGQIVILTGEEEDTVAYIGLDTTKDYLPLNFVGADSHAMVGNNLEPGYLDRIETVIEEGKFPVEFPGFETYDLCSEDTECPSQQCVKSTLFSYQQCLGTECQENHDCATGRCYNGKCLPKFGSCMECNDDMDCASGKCLLFRCANLFGKMDDDCRCYNDQDCDSSRCDGVSPPICKAKLEGGVYCNEHSDCISDRCNWFFHCTGESSGRNNESSGAFIFWILLALCSLGFIFFEHVILFLRRGYVPIGGQSTHE